MGTLLSLTEEYFLDTIRTEEDDGYFKFIKKIEAPHLFLSLGNPDHDDDEVDTLYLGGTGNGWFLCFTDEKNVAIINPPLAFVIEYEKEDGYVGTYYELNEEFSTIEDVENEINDPSSIDFSVKNVILYKEDRIPDEFREYLRRYLHKKK